MKKCGLGHSFCLVTYVMKFKNIWLTIGFVLVLLVIVVSLLPCPPSPAEFKGSDKLEHFVAWDAFKVSAGTARLNTPIWEPMQPESCALCF